MSLQHRLPPRGDAERSITEPEEDVTSTMRDMDGRRDPGSEIRCQQVVELVTDYLEGALDPATVAEFEAHLALCPGCVTYLDQIRDTVRSLGSVPLQSLSSTARARLLSAFGDMSA